MSKRLSDDQKTFNKVARHLLKQNAKSMRAYSKDEGDGESHCAYRGDNGRRCAAGILITNNEYKPSFEGQAVYNSPEVDPLFRKKGLNIRLCYRLQGVHDGDDVRDWPKSLERVATEYGLKMPVINT
jgi:hypothetical protein